MSTPLDPRTKKVLAQRILARRRLLHFVRQTFPNYSAGWVHEDICMRLERFSQDIADKKSPRLMLLVPPRHGKLLADDTLVYTDSGWKTHGTLQVGDKVLGINLEWTNVIGVSRPGLADVEVTTNAGTKVLCHRNHEWAVEEYCAKTLSNKGRRGYYPTVVETNRFLEHKAQQGSMMAARKTTMRRFYLPDILTAKQKLPIELMRVLQLRRRPLNGGHLAIEDVRIVEEPQPGKCIQVDAEDGVYLVTRDLIPTHNSELASIRFPAWHLGQYPEHEIINCGYNLDLPMKFSRKVRELLRDPAFQPIFPNCVLDPQSQSIEAWYTTAGGGFTAAGVGGGITGKGAHCAYFKVQCATQRGILPISDVRVGDRVLAHDHNTKTDTWAEVQAVSTQYKPAIVEAGQALCTPDHLVWTEQDGYVEAGTLTEDHTTRMSPLWPDVPAQRERASPEPEAVRPRRKDVLFARMRESARDRAGNVRMREQEGTPRRTMPDLLSERSARRARLHPLRHSVRSPDSSARAQSSATRRGLKSFLLPRLLRHLPRRASRATNNVAEHLRRVWRRHYRGWAEILQRGMLPIPQGAQCAVLGGLEQGEARIGETLRSAVYELRPREGSDGGASHRPRRDEPRAEQSGAAVRGVPQPLSSSMHGTCAADLARLLPDQDEGQYWVVDIQTTTGNFYGDNTLLHNCLIIDDPIKNQEEADSVLVRDKLDDWYQSTAYTRLAPGGGVLVIETWWNDDDLAGRLQQRMAVDPEADQYEVVRYPALADQYEYRNPATLEIHRSPIELEPADIRGYQLLRIPGQALHPDRYPEEALRRIKANMQPRIWSALYQQNPVPDEGMYFTKDMFRFEAVSPPPAGGRIFTAWDFAIGEKQTNDWNVGATILQDDMDRIHVLDVVRFRGAANDIVSNIVAVAQQWGNIPKVDYRIGFEDGQIFKALKPSIMRGLQDAKCFPSFEVMAPLTDKQARGRPLQGRMQQGRVFFPENGPWLATAMQEMLRFPAGAHDDVVDALAWAVRLSLLQPPPTRELPKPLKSWRDRLAGLGTSGSHMAS